jgi:hypothetical protein
MSKKFSTAHLAWSDRFALIDAYQPSDTAIMETFNLSTDELATARQLRASGTFSASKTLDVASYGGIFAADTTTKEAIVSTPTTKNIASTAHSKPESASKKVKVPQKRGRKGDKIAIALMSATETPVPVTDFMAKHGVSLAVLRQAKRFIEKMDADTQTKIGKVNVKQDKVTKTLMIWKAA